MRLLKTWLTDSLQTARRCHLISKFGLQNPRNLLFFLTKCLLQAVHKTFHNLLLLLSVFDMVRFRWKSRIQGLWRQFSSEFQIQFTQWRWQTPPKMSTDSIWWKNLQIPIINFHFSEAFGLICIHIVPALKFISSYKHIPNIIKMKINTARRKKNSKVKQM